MNNDLKQILDDLKIENKIVNNLDIENLNLSRHMEIILYNYLLENGIDIKYTIKDSDYADSDNIFAVYLNDISCNDFLTKEEEYELYEKYQRTHDENIKNEFLKHYYHLVVYYANRYKKVGVSIMDLIQEGNIALLCAFNNFKTSMNYRFTTYATRYIRTYIFYSMAKNDGLINLSRELYKLLVKIKFYMNDYFALNGVYPTESEIKDKFKITDDVYNIILLNINEHYSLNDSLFNEEDDDRTLIKLLKSSDISVEEQVEDKLIADVIIEEVDRITTSKKADIFKMWYGLSPYEYSYTLLEIGKKYGLTKERIRVIKNDVLTKLKKSKKILSLVRK